MNITKKSFGVLADGREVKIISLESEAMRAEILDFGATLRSLMVKDCTGQWTDVVLGYDTPAEYDTNGGYLGACVGRHANRIGGGKFTLNGETYTLCCNDGPNHLHGGLVGFDHRTWEHEALSDGVSFRLVSPDGDQGYPGTLSVTVTYRILPESKLEITYEAHTDKDTVCNLTNHSYFNLDGSADILSHTLMLDAESYTENDRNCLPTGKIVSVEGTPFDFRKGKPLGQDINTPDPQLVPFGGYDHNFVIAGSGLRHAAKLSSAQSGITMDVMITNPGMQLYTSNSLPTCNGKYGKTYGCHSGVCLESQFFPNAMACDNFEKPILRVGETYRQQTVFVFSVS